MLRPCHSNPMIKVILLAGLILNAGCSSSEKNKDNLGDQKRIDAQLASDLEKRANQIAPGFVLAIRHPEDSKIDGQYQVQFTGDILLPYNVKIRAAGLTLNELRDRLTNAYNQFFTSKSSVKVEIAKKQYWVEVRGLVQKPGRYLIQRYSSLEEVLAMAGGVSGDQKDLKSDSRAEYVKIVLPDFNDNNKIAHTRWIRLSDYFARSDNNANISWFGGERLFLQTSIDPSAKLDSRLSSIRIMGEVARPGEYDIRPEEDLYSYLARAGGPTTSADLTEVTIIRKEERTTDEVDLLKGRAFVKLEAGDVVLVKSITQKPSGFEKGLSLTAIIAGIITPILLIVLLL